LQCVSDWRGFSSTTAPVSCSGHSTALGLIELPSISRTHPFAPGGPVRRPRRPRRIGKWYRPRGGPRVAVSWRGTIRGHGDCDDHCDLGDRHRIHISSTWLSNKPNKPGVGSLGAGRCRVWFWKVQYQRAVGAAHRSSRALNGTPPGWPAVRRTLFKKVGMTSLRSANKATEGGCVHLHSVVGTPPSGLGCVECLEAGCEWIHLRICVTCGHVGCCDRSPHRHAMGHWLANRDHPLVRSYEDGEDWWWCYPEELLFEVRGAPPSPSHGGKNAREVSARVPATANSTMPHETVG
jgi:hypothetical protein